MDVRAPIRAALEHVIPELWSAITVLIHACVITLSCTIDEWKMAMLPKFDKLCGDLNIDVFWT